MINHSGRARLKRRQQIALRTLRILAEDEAMQRGRFIDITHLHLPDLVAVGGSINFDHVLEVNE